MSLKTWQDIVELVTRVAESLLLQRIGLKLQTSYYPLYEMINSFMLSHRFFPPIIMMDFLCFPSSSLIILKSVFLGNNVHKIMTLGSGLTFLRRCHVHESFYFVPLIKYFFKSHKINCVAVCIRLKQPCC